jgi:hypothetical protein
MPARVPFGEMTIICSIQVCAEARGTAASNPRRVLRRELLDRDMMLATGVEFAGVEISSGERRYV